MAKRTEQQQKAIEVLCREYAEKFNAAGYDKVAVLSHKALPVEWTQPSVKADLFKAVMKALYPDKVSTTELEISEVSRVHENLDRWVSENFQISVEFPSEERLMQEK